MKLVVCGVTGFGLGITALLPLTTGLKNLVVVVAVEELLGIEITPGLPEIQNYHFLN